MLREDLGISYKIITLAECVSIRSYELDAICDGDNGLVIVEKPDSDHD